MERPAAMFPLCALLKPDGTQCGSPALTGSNFCFHHIGGRLPKPRPDAPPASAPPKFVFPDSYAAIQHNLFLVVQALNEGKIDNRTANTYNRMFRACQLNLRQAEDAGMSINLDPAELDIPEPNAADNQNSLGDQESESSFSSMNSADNNKIHTDAGGQPPTHDGGDPELRSSGGEANSSAEKSSVLPVTSVADSIPFHLLSPEEQRARKEAFEIEYFGSIQPGPLLNTEPMTDIGSI